jgi:tRNA (cmo5U34)-methyltransferase
MSESRTSEVQTRFDRAAAEWDSNPTRVALARAVTEAIRKAVTLRSDMDAMDFGAGTGLVTLGLLPFVRELVAVDASREMLRVLDEKVKALKVSNVHTMLCEIGETLLPAARFDLIVSSMVLHHIADVPEAIEQLRTCLRPGGWIALADLDTEDGSFHPDPAGVFHSGFDRADVCGWLETAGFKHVASGEAYRIMRPAPDGHLRQYPVFLVTGQATR